MEKYFTFSYLAKSCNAPWQFTSHHLQVHAGGIDLKFPHHTNEIAQAEAFHGLHLSNSVKPEDECCIKRVRNSYGCRMCMYKYLNIQKMSCDLSLTMLLSYFLITYSLSGYHIGYIRGIYTFRVEKCPNH